MSNQSETKNTSVVIKGASITFVGMIYQLLMSFISGIIITRTIGADSYGVFSITRTLAEIFTVFTKLGFDIGLVRFFGEKSALEHKQNNAHFLKLVLVTVALLSIVPVIIIWLGGGQKLEEYVYQYEGFSNVIMVMVLLIPLISLVQVMSGAFRGVLNIKPRVYGELFIQPTIRLCLILVLFYFGWQLWSVVVGTVASFFMVLMYFLFLTNKYFFRFIKNNNNLNSQNLYKELIRVGKYSMVISFTMAVAMLLIRVDVIMLGYFVSSDKVGQYVVIQMIVGLIVFVNAALNQMVAPMLSRLYKENNTEEMRRLIRQHTRWVMVASVPLFVLLAQYGIHIMTIFGEDFAIETLALPILAFSQLLVAVFSSAGFMLSMTGSHRLEFYTMSSALICNVILNYFLIQEMGITGAALSTLISVILANSMRMYQVSKKFGFYPADKIVLYPFLLGVVIMYVLLSLNSSIILLTGLYEKLIISFLFILIYTLSIYNFCLINEDKVLVNKLVNKILCRRVR